MSAVRLKSNAELSDCHCCMRVMLVSMGQGGAGMGTPELLGKRLLGEKNLDAEISIQISNSDISPQVSVCGYMCICMCIYMYVSGIMTFDFWMTFSLFCTYCKSSMYKILLCCSLSADKPAFLLSEPVQVVEGEKWATSLTGKVLIVLKSSKIFRTTSNIFGFLSVNYFLGSVFCHRI